MKILLLGSGGRENALAWKIAQSPMVRRLFVAPGNPGMTPYGEMIPLALSDFEGIRQFIRLNGIDMLVVGPEAPLAEGITDFLKQDPALEKLAIIGPGRSGALLESSKDFAKAFMLRHHIPTAAYRSFDAGTFDEALDFLKTLAPPYVLKADGLAAGKGVVICEDFETAVAELGSMLLDERFGEASRRVVIEEFLRGIEVSVFVITDGTHYQLLPEAKDYKRIGEGDAGANTGGMGAVSPVPFATKEFMQKVEERIIQPTIQGLHSENIPYVGFIFFGLIRVEDEPFVIEYNARLGDPETEAILPRLKTDLVELMLAAAEKRLASCSTEFYDETAAAVMLVSGGYPGDYQTGLPIKGHDQITDALLFHAGTRTRDGQLQTNGGRVMAITSLGDNIADAFARAYDNAGRIQFDGRYLRYDLGKDLCQP
jgi:phosphoribosylamine--glycine ligase